MTPADDAPDGRHDDPLDQLRHELLTPVTVISARVGMMERTVRRSASLSDEERGRLLADARSIQAAVLSVCAVVDGFGVGTPRLRSARTSVRAPGSTPGRRRRSRSAAGADRRGAPG